MTCADRVRECSGGLQRDDGHVMVVVLPAVVRVQDPLAGEDPLHQALGQRSVFYNFIKTENSLAGNMADPV